MNTSDYPKKNKPNLLFKFLIFERKIDDTKLYKICKTKPIGKLTQMFITKVLTTDYNSWTLSARGKNKAKTKPNEPNGMLFKPNLLDAQTNPKRTQTNPICSLKTEYCL
jgi:hypothetical protein